jgi:putative pyruvate formate lyase activating enzyme
MKPLYLNLSTEELEERAQKAWEFLKPCRICPRKCGVNRAEGITNQKLETRKLGFCQVGPTTKISSYHSHFGEESCLVGTHGSGTIFFSSCNLACVYCQNWEISQLRLGSKITNERLGKIMLELQNKGCHNINFVSPTIWVPQILKALMFAIPKALKLPLVYNTGGYDSVETLRVLDRIVDIYMPDIKYSDSKIGLKYSLVPNYWEEVQKAIKEMFRQVGDLVIEGGLAKRGLLIRHLVLPNNLTGTKKVMEFLAKEVSKNTYVNIMAQYRPEHKALQFPKLSRKITSEEYEEAVKIAKEVGLWRFDKP